MGIDLRQSEAYANWMRSLGWKIVISHQSSVTCQNYIYLRKIPLIGSVVKLQRPNEPIPYEELAKIAKENRALFVKIEPDISRNGQGLVKQLERHKYYYDRWALLATKTIRINLAKSENDIYGQFSKDCRYEIRKAQTGDLVISRENFDSFYKLLKTANKIKGLWTYPETQFRNMVKAFGDNVFCIDISIHRNQKPIAGCLVFIADKVAYYFLAGALPEGKKLHAPYLVVWEAIKEAKKRGCILWDFEGIYDERVPSTKKWKGFTHFKKSFGGEEITFPGSFTWYRNPIFRIFSLFS
jgi:lipid II:glycine glycyltransferase (peptidoglycan interpeptide bridge formation enzyme)